MCARAWTAWSPASARPSNASPGFAQTAASASQTLDKRSGVGQEHAHLFVSCCRSLGVPARFVSGYLCTESTADTQMTSHAWAEAWVDGAGWLTYDVANRLSNAKAQIRVAVGLDYLDTAPVRGVRRGANDSMDVEITIADARQIQIKQRQQQQAQQ